MRRASTIVVALTGVLLLTACPKWRDVANDAKKGAAAGWAIGGPEGAAIGSVTVAIVCGIWREIEKRQLRREGVLTDKRARQEAITARTARPAPPPQSLFPTDSTLGD